MILRTRLSSPKLRAYCFAALLGVIWHVMVRAVLQDSPFWEEPYGLIAGALAGLAAGAFCLATEHYRSLCHEAFLTLPTLIIGVLAYWVFGNVIHHGFGAPEPSESLLEPIMAIPLVLFGVLTVMGWIWIPLAWGTRQVFLSFARSEWCAE